jgi:hypothetical protein
MRFLTDESIVLASPEIELGRRMSCRILIMDFCSF